MFANLSLLYVYLVFVSTAILKYGEIYSFPPYPISYRVITYIVISKPKRMSVADGVVHIVVLLLKIHTALVCITIVLEKMPLVHSDNH